MKASVVFSVLSLMAAVLDTSGCALHGTYLSWHNGEPIGKRFDVESAAECEAACKGTPGCAAWTLNTRNGWCAFKSKEQIRPETNEGFESAILDDKSEFCPAGPAVPHVVDGSLLKNYITTSNWGNANLFFDTLALKAQKKWLLHHTIIFQKRMTHAPPTEWKEYIA